MIKELKKELSALSGVDFFNPKFREVFKRYFPNDNEEVTAEEERLSEIVEEEATEPVVEATEEVVEEKAEEVVEEPAVDVKEEQPAEEKAEEVVEAEQEVEEVANEETPVAEEVAEVVEDIPAEEVVEDKIDDHKELIDAKVELELVKAGVREDRLESAKKLLMSEIKTMEDVDNVKDWIKQYPEWLKSEKPVAKAIGMTLDNAGDGLTEEEKRLKDMGINPR